MEELQFAVSQGFSAAAKEQNLNNGYVPSQYKVRLSGYCDCGEKEYFKLCTGISQYAKHWYKPVSTKVQLSDQIWPPPP